MESRHSGRSCSSWYKFNAIQRFVMASPRTGGAGSWNPCSPSKLRDVVPEGDKRLRSGIIRRAEGSAHGRHQDRLVHLDILKRLQRHETPIPDPEAWSPSQDDLRLRGSRGIVVTRRIE